MAAKFILILFVTVLSVAIAMPAAEEAKTKAPTEDMKTAETTHILPFSLNLGYGAYSRYSPYGYRSGSGLGLDYPINPYYSSYGYGIDHPYYPYYY